MQTQTSTSNSSGLYQVINKLMWVIVVLILGLIAIPLVMVFYKGPKPAAEPGVEAVAAGSNGQAASPVP
ncbi:MAG TPA: hypothetical protein DCQ34_03760, partial [Chitinophagaceae bacterium]|nr:hypothetical protein [Chitinophagaceae bacterium]